MTDEERDALVEKMAIAVAGLSWIGSHQSYKAALRDRMRTALAVAEPVIAAELTALRAENTRLRTFNEALRAENAKLRDALERIAGGDHPEGTSLAVNSNYRELESRLRAIARAALKEPTP